MQKLLKATLLLLVTWMPVHGTWADEYDDAITSFKDCLLYTSDAADDLLQV